MECAVPETSALKSSSSALCSAASASMRMEALCSSGTCAYSLVHLRNNARTPGSRTPRSARRAPRKARSSSIAGNTGAVRRSACPSAARRSGRQNSSSAKECKTSATSAGCSSACRRPVHSQALAPSSKDSLRHRRRAQPFNNCKHSSRVTCAIAEDMSSSDSKSFEPSSPVAALRPALASALDAAAPFPPARRSRKCRWRSCFHQRSSFDRNVRGSFGSL
mmetsp:Transcript_21311/g.42870  ORF Transcript_21311/g.42870 Transcript_21311/m.42870 type:complete len:221 (-) Transcript_21311:386-1048(-)